MSANIFEIAVSKKIRFESPKGLLSVEDLYDLPLTSIVGKANLNDIAKGLYAKLKSEDNIDFVAPVQKKDDSVQLKFDIVKHIIDVRVAERDAKAEAAARADKKQRILAAIAQKENEALSDASIEDLRKMAESL